MRHRLKQKWSSPKDDGTYGSWSAMRARCNGEGNHAHYYSGISVCPEWRDFDQFYKDMGARPVGLTLDRIDPNKGYAPGNCRWATRKEQANNQRRSVVLTHGGQTRTLSAWAEHLGVPYYLLWNRIRKHKHDLAKALTPVRFVVRKTP